MKRRAHGPAVVLPGFVRRHPAAVAWDRWCASEEGQRCLDVASLGPGPYLKNRLRLAFEAAWLESERFRK